MADRRLIRAAGCVPWRPASVSSDNLADGAAGDASEHREWLVIHRPHYNDWSFPKGKLDRNEKWLAAALREFDEETGLSGDIGCELDEARYVDHKGRDKVVRYWMLRVTGGTFVANDEVDELAWLAAAQARDRLSYEHDRVLLDQAEAIVVPSPS